MKTLTTTLLITLFLSSACAAQFQYPLNNGEAMVDVIRRGDTLTITAADHENLPAAIQQDLLEFAAAVVALPHPVEETLVIFSHYGPQAAAGRFTGSLDPEPPSGVWLWPDWRDAANIIHFPEFSRVRFYGNNRYVRLEHHEPTAGGRYIRHDYIVDMTDPTQRWKYDGLALLRVAENGRWVGVRKDGQLFVGMLEPGNVMSIVENRTPIATPTPVAVGYSTDQETNLLLLPDGSYLVAELDQGQGQSGRQLLIMTGDGTQQVALLAGGLGNDHADGRDSFYGFTGELGVDTTYTFFTLTPTGQLQMVDLEGPNAPSGWSDARAAGSTPSGKFEMCYRDIPPFGAVQTLMLRTPKADPAEPIPPFKSFDWRASDDAGLPRPVVSGHWIHWN